MPARQRPGRRRRLGAPLAALEAGEIDGALVAAGEDPDEPWQGVPSIATTTEELLERAGSFYNQTLALAALDSRASACRRRTDRGRRHAL